MLNTNNRETNNLHIKQNDAKEPNVSLKILFVVITIGSPK